MNFITFPVNATNIFPIANTTKGGQFVTEFNLRSRESVGTPESVKYMIGPSYVHAIEDFYVRALSESTDIFSNDVASTHTLEILPGRGVINGHFVETLVPMTIDMIVANEQAKRDGVAPLIGDLVVGLRVMYSTEQTMAGSILAENAREMYEGVQVVILSKDEFKLPTDTDACTNQSLVTAHIKLAEFKYYNSTISNVVNNYPSKCTMLPASRIENVDNLLSDMYIRKSGLNPKKLYTFAGYGTLKDKDGNALNVDTWCDSVDSLMVWDNGTEDDMLITVPDNYKEHQEAHFQATDSGTIQLYLPHKQPHYDMRNLAGEKQIYRAKTYDLPVANFANNTPGTVDKNYTQNIKNIADKINNLYNLPSGKQRYFIDELVSRDDLPRIDTSWTPGDYVLVRRDKTVSDSTEASYTTPPASMYVILPGRVRSISYSDSKPRGVELAYVFLDNVDGPNTTDPDVYNQYFNLGTTEYRGVFAVDYFTVGYNDTSGDTKYVYYVVNDSGEMIYSEPVFLTGEIPLAQTNLVGGFLNVDDTATDYGYVIRDENGHLRLLDYALLRSGTLAYQLGEDFSTPNGLTTAEIQSYLDEYVNQRVAFPNFNHSQNAENPNVININIYLPEESAETAESARTLNIYDIDTRFNTAVYIHIYGNANSNTIINISDCQRVRIDSNVGGTPIINLYRSSLYYDATVLDMLNVIYDLHLWYQRYETSDPNLLVDYMTVRELDAPITGSSIHFWDTETPNDNHFMYALQSLTFGSDGTIVGCSLLVKNTSTSNVEIGKSIIVGSYEIPQGAGLVYPATRLTKPIKVTGQFVSAYWTGGADATNPWLIQNTSFTAVSQTYDPYNPAQMSVNGSISFLVDSFYISNIQGIATDTMSIDGWDPDTYHVFNGSIIS